jgi:hypothetical protein
VFRGTIIQLAVPDALRGRLAGLQIAVVTGGPRVGDLESGAVAAAFGNTVSVVSGGLACIAGALLLARALPGFRRQRMDPAHHEAAAPAGLGAAISAGEGAVLGERAAKASSTNYRILSGNRACCVLGSNLSSIQCSCGHEKFLLGMQGVSDTSNSAQDLP